SRGLTGFVINVTWLLLPLLLGIPVIKGSQAIGPFTRPYLKFSPYLLRKASAVYARGNETERFLRKSGIPCRGAPDVAFLLEPEPAPVPTQPYIALVPSAVVRRRCDRLHGRGAYLAMLGEVVEKLVETKLGVLVVAHSYRDKA